MADQNTPSTAIPIKVVVVDQAGAFVAPGAVTIADNGNAVEGALADAAIITTPGTLTLDIRYGSIIVATSPAYQLNAVAKTNVTWMLDLMAVIFDVPMPDTNYEVVLSGLANLGAVVWPSALTTAGFTLNVSVAIAGAVSYVATHR